VSKKQVYIGETILNTSPDQVEGNFVVLENEQFYKISNVDNMNPFFMSIVSNSDHWMFIWSNGGLSAGRKNPDSALFPYYTDDKILDSADITGNKTIILASLNNKTFLWEPFSDKYSGLYNTERNLYKNIFGNKVIFEEINNDLGLLYHYTWCNSEKYGFIKRSKIINLTSNEVSLSILDGIQNVLPYGVEQKLQEVYSTLADGYKKNELDTKSGLGLYSLSSIPVDKAEPSEALKATTVWSTGLENSTKLLSSSQLNRFRKGCNVEQEVDIKALRGAYFDVAEINLSASAEKEWFLVAELNQDAAEVMGLIQKLINRENIKTELIKEIEKGTVALTKIIANADGLQRSADKLTNARHYANVLFNVMRGGIFEKDYQVRKDDLLKFAQSANFFVFEQFSDFFGGLNKTINYIDLLRLAEQKSDSQLLRIIYEYLPLTFSRRHGDPSRPWNQFNIDVQNEDGSPNLSYQGNWRDIFQNWEALGLSFPGYVESMISKFLNASTIDGYNPYRITRDGIDWEILDPADPWSNIGYWGDHQIIYLQKLLELSAQFHPNTLNRFVNQNIFCYANVPYRIKSYAELLSDPRDTILFDNDLEMMINDRVSKTGADGRLVWDEHNEVYQVNLIEKLLVSVLSKFTNFVPEGGIWLNTQRPEWNDANNALVGNGLSMVTLYYIRRFQLFFAKFIETCEMNTFELSEEVYGLFLSIDDAFEKHSSKLQGAISNLNRREMMDDLGKAGENYRSEIYKNGFSGVKKQLDENKLIKFINRSLEYIDHSIRANKRDDHLYHSYNLMKIEKDGSVSIRYLYEMLEGQVAILSSSYLSGSESLQLLSALKNSKLYREDQNSYILYPNRTLARFTDKNNIPVQDFNKSKLLKKLVNEGNREIIIQDTEGNVHFSGHIRNSDVLKKSIDHLIHQGYKKMTSDEIQHILDIYENVFDHQSFTGRSGTFYKYEGLGSIYWHMVSKLLLAVQETLYRFTKDNDDKVIAGKLIEYYYDIRAGIGFNKTVENYGAFPMDPYSHTPAHLGAQQPGMTGQVKEDIMARFGELGVVVQDGFICFDPLLLRKEEFLKTETTFSYYDVGGNDKQLKIPNSSMVFTFNQTPIIYTLSDENSVFITNSANETYKFSELKIDKSWSEHLFNRTGEIKKIEILFCFE
jgi:hypothetical protein